MSSKRVAGGSAGIFVAVGLIAALIALASYAANLLRPVEQSSVDARFELRGQQDAPDDVAVVAVDDVTFSELGVQWPFPRSMHAKVIDRLTKAGAKVIAYDVQFTEPTDPDEDNALIEAVDRADAVVLSTTEVDEKGNANVFGGTSVINSVGARVGNTVVISDPGGVVRSMPYEVDRLETFALVSAHAAGTAQLPGELEKDERYQIDFRGPPGSIDTYSFSQVLNGGVAPARLRGRIVVVGASAPSLQDVHATPFGNKQMAGPEVQANAIWTVANGFPLSLAPSWLTLLTILAFSAIPPVASHRLRPGFSLLLVAAVAVLFVLAAWLAFALGLVVAVAYPLLALALATIGSIGAYYLLKSIEHQQTRATFARFVPEAVIDDVLDRAGEDLRLGGERIVCTVLFSDIRGFTTFSEQRSPDLVVEILNNYLDAMTEAVMDHGGTLVSYMGDGIMAVFGAPIPQGDHADCALAAAREMIEMRLPHFNEWLSELEPGLEFAIGVGLNTGPTMSGQVGSRRRVDYTVIGDTTNTAARLESMTKDTPHSLFLSSTTRDALKTPAGDLEFVEDLPVRGRNKPIGVWTTSATG